jgi:hypothetical protein
MQEARSDVLAQITTPAKRKAQGFRQETVRRLGDLKKEYVSTYAGLHTRARLGVSETARRTELQNDARLRTLNRLANIDLLPRQQLFDFSAELGSLIECTRLTEQDLAITPLCPHCNFKPSNEPVGDSAASRLSSLDEELDRLMAEWARILLENLDDPTAREALPLLKPGERKLVETFLKTRELPEEPDEKFIRAVKDALARLTKLPVKMEDLRRALFNGGSPATPAELRKRFEDYLEELLSGQDVTKVRIVLE